VKSIDAGGSVYPQLRRRRIIEFLRSKQILRRAVETWSHERTRLRVRGMYHKCERGTHRLHAFDLARSDSVSRHSAL